MITVKNIAEIIQEVTSVNLKDIYAGKRERKTSYARALLYHIAYEVASISKSRIARAVGVDHTSVIIALRKSKDMIEKDPSCQHAKNYDAAYKIIMDKYGKDIIHRIDKLKCRELMEEIELIQFALKRVTEELDSISFIRN